MIEKVYRVRTHDDPIAVQLLARLQRMGYGIKQVLLEAVFRVEGVSAVEMQRLLPLFYNASVERVNSTSMLRATDGPIREVSYRRAMTDPEMRSLTHAATAVGITGLQWARLATRYQFIGVPEEVVDEIVHRLLCNHQVQTIIAPGEEWPTLVPQGEVGRVEMLDLRGMDDAALLRLSDTRRLHMPIEQLRAMQQFFLNEGHPARDAEIEMIAAAWSDHCDHGTWKSLGLLQRLQRATRCLSHPLVVSAFVDNAGVMRGYNGWALNVKGETHISPTFAGSPYGGIMTKHGGVIRDVLFTGQGAYPWAGTTIMATGIPRIPWEWVPIGAFHPLVVLRESIRGTHDYTNPMGIPMAWSQYLTDERNWKGLALGHSFGVLPESRARKGKPQPGDYVVLIGEPTGNDGLHGATVSSAKMTADTSTVDAAHVQIGMPIGERVFMEAIPVLRDADCIRACTDCGAAGLSSAVGEMGSETGVWVNLARVPLKCASMRPWQIWLSESQERGILCVPEEKLEEALRILADYEVPAAVIGIFTDSKRCQVIYDRHQSSVVRWWKDARWRKQITRTMANPKTVVVDLPNSFLHEQCPLPTIVVGGREQRQLTERCTVPRRLSMPRSREGWERLLRRHLGHFDISDQSVAAHRYDQTVQGKTVVPYIGGVNEDMLDDIFVATPVLGESWGAGIAVAVNQRWADISPCAAGQHLMAQAMAKLVAAGFSPDDITCCVNVYTPRVTDSPQNAARLIDLVQGYANASEALGMPVISGKDSSSGTFIPLEIIPPPRSVGRGLPHGNNPRGDSNTPRRFLTGFTTKDGRRIDAPLTCCVAALGRIANAGSVIRKPFKRPGDKLLFFAPGALRFSVGGSVFLDSYGYRGDQLSLMDIRAFRAGLDRYARFASEIGYGQQINSRTVVGDGGLIRRLFEMSLGNGLGCRVVVPSQYSVSELLFSEYPSLLIALRSRFVGRALEALGQYSHVIGEVTEEAMIELYNDGRLLFAAPIEELATEWRRTFREVVS